MTPLQKFLFERKVELLDKEKRANGIAQVAMTMQLQVIDSMFQFLATQQTEEDMAKLRLTLEKQATPVDDIKPRQDNAEITDALIELTSDLEQAWKEEVKLALKEKRQPKDLKFPLNNLPPEIKQKSVSSKIYGLRKAGKIPPNILPATRTITDKETGEAKEVLYMKWVKTPPPIDKQGE